MNRKAAHIFQIAGIGLWFVALSPAILAIHAQKSIHPRFTEAFTLSDIIYLLAEIFTIPGEYYAWILSAIIPNLGESSALALFISTLLFAPFVIWPFLKQERYHFLRKILCFATIVFIIVCLSVLRSRSNAPHQASTKKSTIHKTVTLLCYVRFFKKEKGEQTWSILPVTGMPGNAMCPRQMASVLKSNISNLRPNW